MKIIFLIALLAFTMATQVKENNGNIDFELDTHKESVF